MIRSCGKRPVGTLLSCPLFQFVSVSWRRWMSFMLLLSHNYLLLLRLRSTFNSNSDVPFFFLLIHQTILTGLCDDFIVHQTVSWTFNDLYNLWCSLTLLISLSLSLSLTSQSSNPSKIWMRYFCPFSTAATPGWSGKNRSIREQLYWGLSTDFQRDLRPCFYWVIPGLTLCCPEATPVKWKHCDLICSLELLQLEETVLSVSLQVCIIVGDLFWQLN